MMVKMNNIRKAAFCSLIAVMAIAMITSNQLSTYASPTTEDDGWSEGDYEGSQEEQEEQAQDEWEDAGRPGDNDNDNDDDNDDNNENQDEETQICPDGSVLPVDQECPQPELQICSDGSAATTLAECPPTPEPVIPNTAFTPGFYAESYQKHQNLFQSVTGAFKIVQHQMGTSVQQEAGHMNVK